MRAGNRRHRSMACPVGWPIFTEAVVRSRKDRPLILCSCYAKVTSAAHSARALLRVERLSLQRAIAVWAGVAQLVEHLICNQRVGGSSPFASSSSTQ